MTEPVVESTPRIERLRETMLAEPYSICLERPQLLQDFRHTRAGKRARKEHPAAARAAALAHLLAHRKPRIYDDELIIGNMSSKRIGANYYPEGGSVNILEDLPRWNKRHVPLQLTASEKRKLLLLGLRGVRSSVGGLALLRRGRTSHFLDFFRAQRYFITEEAGISHQVVDYGRVVREGLQPLDDEGTARLAAGTLADGTPLGDDNRAFFTSVSRVIGGIRELASNLAGEAERLADEGGIDGERRVELRAAAAACRHVPLGPARTFQEGLQACWLIHIALNMEDFEQGLSFGRLDQILLPLYRADLEAGRLTEEGAVELLASFCLKTNETIPLYSERVDRYFSGFGVAQGITLGGTDATGEDATNELSGLILDAYAQVRMREPALHARVHADTPEAFLRRCAGVVQLGTSKPSFFGDAAVVPALQEAGITQEHARDYAVIGCVEMASQGRTYNSSDAALFNLPLCLELALNEGQQFAGGPRVGAATPPVAEMTTFEQVVDAFRAQVADGVDDMAKVIGWLEAEYAVFRTTPVNSMLTDGCLASGEDVTWGGARYNLTSIQCAGLADAGESLLAIRKLVFEQGRFDLPALVQILRDDFEGQDVLRAELRHRFPRYGNGDAEADGAVQLAADVYSDVITAQRNSRGGRWVPGFYSMTCHHGFGQRTGALPSGRLAGERLSNGFSPVDGADRQGPTSLLRSAAALDTRRWSNAGALNVKFDQRTVEGEKGRHALAALVGGYMDSGGMQVQINVLDADTLRCAQRDPDSHRGLVVRVAGYCANFADLQPEVQDEIIARTVHGL